MEVLIKDLCKEKKDSLNLTNQNIADRANLSASTVNNYFSESSKAPSVYTVGPICAALGVSLDSYQSWRKAPAFRHGDISHTLLPRKEILRGLH